MLCQHPVYRQNVAFNATLPLMEPFERLRMLRRARGLTQEQLGLAVGFDQDQARQRVSKIEKNRVRLTTTDLRKFADALHTTPSDILDGSEITPTRVVSSGKRGVPVVGTLVEQGEAIPLVAYSANGTERKIVGHVERPPSLRGVRHGYALYVFDDSMEPRYAPGWLLYVNPTKPPRAGRDVLVVRRDGAPLVRQLERQTRDTIVLRALSGDERISLKPDEITDLHLVVGSDQEG